jgi:pimeloyl-ACP methyl ester carboxylesterase
MEQFRRGDLVFDVRDVGPADGPVVVLLHGFPQRNDSWSAVIDKLTAQGYRCLAPNQRGYSPGARPPRRRDYRMSELLADVAALIDASGAERVHLVGHDWGAAVAWNVAARLPERLASVSPISVPHPTALVKAMWTSRQVLASWYMFFFQLPRVPERLLLRRDGSTTGMAASLERGGQTPANAARDVAAMSEPGALTAALNWYRAMFLSNPPGKITVPTMYVWSDGDTALLDKAAHASGGYVGADYRFEVLRGVSHWVPEERSDALADLLLEWFSTHPKQTQP